MQLIHSIADAKRIRVAVDNADRSRLIRRGIAICSVFVLVSVQHTASFAALLPRAQEESPTAEDVAAELTAREDGGSQKVDVAKEVQVDPVNSDQKIAKRLNEIMEATGWFDEASVEVDRGVAFLSGRADSQQHYAWAEATAMNTMDVVAVVNRIEISERPVWNFAPAAASLKQLGREFTGILPLLVIALVIATISYFSAISAARLTRWFFQDRIDSKLLRQVVGNVVGVLLFILGAYVALRVSGLTRLAFTLLGGTSLVGLALGFAFRDIAENYLASILISLNRPFRVGDLIEVDGAQGFVRKVTTRGTVLNTLDGNQVQMPNSTVYKGTITNYTATPRSRRDFTVGIGFDDSAAEAQSIIMEVLKHHSAVVDDPAPIVIVESLGSATVNLRVFYWIDQHKHSALKVSSSVIRMAKQKLTEAEITMPDEARELVFPQGVPVRMLAASSHSEIVDRPEESAANEIPARGIPIKEETESSDGEGNLASEQSEVMRATADDATVKDEVNLIE